MMAAAQTNTVAKPVFLGFKTEQVVDNNFNTFTAISRALRIFLISFGGYDQICPQLYQQKLVEYMNAMKILYGVHNINQNMITTEINSLSNESIKITIGIKQFRGRRLVTNPRIIIINGIEATDWIALNSNAELQTSAQYSEEMLFHDLIHYRKNRTDITIILEGENWKMGWSELNQFNISYDQIPAEGYEEWFYFGRGIRLLVKIEMKVLSKVELKVFKKFHLHSIIYMVRDRLGVYRSGANVGPTHRRFGRRYKVTYSRKKVEPNTTEAFWPSPVSTNLLQNIQSLADTNEEEYSRRMRAILKSDVKYNDLQIGFKFTDDYNDRVCLCSEWCNWNAFFHYNPIYRFLMVQNNQFFLESRTNITDMYLFASTFCAYEAGLNLQPNQALPQTPVLRLMNCANVYMHIINQGVYLTNKEFKKEYGHSYPDPRFLNGLTYNLLRYEIRLPELWLQSDVDPLSNVCIENICNYYQMYSQLHMWCSNKSSLVSSDDMRKWHKELDATSRKHYKTYLKLSYDKRIANKHINYDFLFTEDYEYSFRSHDKYIKSIRDNILKMGRNDNPLNVKVICNNFLSTFVSIYKFIRIVEPSIPSARLSARSDLFQCFKTLDDDFTSLAQNSEFDFKFDEQFIDRRGLEEMRKYLTIFFTLKVYFVASGIQSECIHSVIKMKTKVKSRGEQTCNQFNFIWDPTLIERKLRRDFPNLTLFEINREIEQRFEEFYENFWGKSDHEVNRVLQYSPNIASGYFQYQRLYFWWRNDGNNKFKFRAIFHSLNRGFQDIIKQSENIYLAHILPSIQTLSQSYAYYLEVFDVLVQYLIKADCYMIMTLIAIFFRKLHSLQIQWLTKKHISYTMTKPGWVPIFRTMSTCFQYLYRLETHYIVFDDEFNKLSKAFRTTKKMIKEIYRDLYKKLVSEWLQELNRIAGLQNLYPSSEQFISMHLAVGLSFTAAFIDDFRPQSRYFRKFLMSILDYTSNEPHQQILNYFIVGCEHFLTQPQAIQTAMPLLWPMWQQEINSVDFNHFNQMTGPDVGINLNAADS